MSENEALLRLAEIFRDIFDEAELEINESTSPDEIEDWGSLEHIQLVVAIEKEFSVKFAMNEVAQMKSVGNILRFLEMKGICE